MTSSLSADLPASDNPPPSTTAPSLDRTLSATAAAVSPVDDRRIAGLVAALVGIAVAGGVFAARAHRS